MSAEADERMACAEVVRLLWDYLDGELDAERTRRIREHLAGCEQCREHLTFDGAFLRSVARLIDDPPPATPLRARVVDALRAAGYDAEPYLVRDLSPGA